jgi:hypothetical protein
LAARFSSISTAIDSLDRFSEKMEELPETHRHFLRRDGDGCV